MITLGHPAPIQVTEAAIRKALQKGASAFAGRFNIGTGPCDGLRPNWMFRVRRGYNNQGAAT
jgi:hypothetical protein